MIVHSFCVIRAVNTYRWITTTRVVVIRCCHIFLRGALVSVMAAALGVVYRVSSARISLRVSIIDAYNMQSLNCDCPHT